MRTELSNALTSSVGGHRGDNEPFGIAGLRVSGDRKGAQLWVETCGECQAGTSTGQFEILYYAAPDHGVLRYRVDEGAWQSLVTKTAPIVLWIVGGLMLIGGILLVLIGPGGRGSRHRGPRAATQPEPVGAR